MSLSFGHSRFDTCTRPGSGVATLRQGRGVYLDPLQQRCKLRRQREARRWYASFFLLFSRDAACCYAPVLDTNAGDCLRPNGSSLSLPAPLYDQMQYQEGMNGNTFSRDFWGSYGDPPRRTYPSGTDPPKPLSPDLVRTRFRPDSDLKRVISGPDQVEIKSKSGPNQVRAVRVGGPL